jgi:hypothetical protein
MTAAVASPRAQSTTRAATPSGRPRRRPWLVILSALSMVVCAGAFALFYVRADDRVQVLAMARPVAAGQTIAVADLRVVRVVPDAGVALVPAATASRVIGRTAVVPLAAGSLLTDSQLGPAAWPPAGQAVVAVAVKAGRLAAGVSPGVRVLVIPVAKDGDTPPAKPVQSSRDKPSPIRATVVQVVDGGGSDHSVVSLLVSRQDAVAVAGAAGDVSIIVAQD